MSTDNYQVTVYLPSELLEYVEDYCKYKGILRKKDSKPILATGLIVTSFNNSIMPVASIGLLSFFRSIPLYLQ